MIIASPYGIWIMRRWSRCSIRAARRAKSPCRPMAIARSGPITNNAPCGCGILTADRRNSRTEREGSAKPVFEALHNGQIWAAAFSPDSGNLVTVGGNGARIWELATGAERMAFTPHGVVASANFSPKGSRIVTGSWDNSAKIWNAETGHAELKLTGHTGYVNSACFSPDGTKVLTASDDRTARLWDAKTGKVIRTFTGHTERVSAAVFSPDGKLVLTGSGDKTARVWNAETAKQLHVLPGHQWGVNSACRVCERWAAPRVDRQALTSTARVWDHRRGKAADHVGRPHGERRLRRHFAGWNASAHRQPRQHGQAVGREHRQGNPHAQSPRPGSHKRGVLGRQPVRAHREPRRHGDRLARRRLARWKGGADAGERIGEYRSAAVSGHNRALLWPVSDRATASDRRSPISSTH